MFYVANLAMTNPECMAAYYFVCKLFQLLKLCGALRNLDHPTAFDLRRMERSLF